MTSKLFLKRVSAEYKRCQESDFKYPNLFLRPLEDDLSEWYFIVCDLKDTQYEGGYYFGVILLPKAYPIKPPDFKFFTPNGRFEVGKKICTDFTGFHPESYSSGQGIVAMTQGMISFMLEDSNGIGSIKTEKMECQELAKSSLSWNKSDELFNKVFPDFDKLLL